MNTALVTLVKMPYRINEAFVKRLRCTHTNPSSIMLSIVWTSPFKSFKEPKYPSWRWNVSSAAIDIFKCLCWYHLLGGGGGCTPFRRILRGWLCTCLLSLVIFIAICSEGFFTYFLFRYNEKKKRYIEHVFICHYTKEDMSQINPKNTFRPLQVANSHVEELLKE